MTPADWGKLLAPVAAAVAVSLGADVASNRNDVHQDQLQQLAEQQEDDALYNCERGNDIRQQIRETLLNFIDNRKQLAEALHPFQSVNCDEQVGSD